ncbi:MAG TPA: hypothetical protein DDY31_17800 [Lachnospiraceae bacterium]|nr:hypothetical protein [Lachnospiraceae bacterium]
MANSKNLIPFSKRSVNEARECGRKGGKKSGEVRRKKADFRKTLNLLLTTEIDSPEWTPILNALGLDSTLEAALNMAMIKEGLAGNVKAYEAVAKYSGQTDKTDTDQEEQKIRVAAAKAKHYQGDEEEEAQDDGFMEALKGSIDTDWDGWQNADDEEEADI